MGKTMVRKPGEGRTLWLLDSLYEVKVAGEETGGALTVMEMTIPPGMGPPPHTHDGTESVYVLEGRLRYYIGDETYEGGPGTFFHIPTDTVERFEPIDTVRVLITYTPGGIDKFFTEFGEPAQERGLPLPSGQPVDFERMRTIAERYGVQMQPMPVR